MTKSSNSPARVSQQPAAIAARNATTAITLLESPESMEQIRRALGSRGDVERFVRAARSHYLSADPKVLAELAKVDPRSYVAACIDAASRGLMPNGRDAYIYPRGTRAVFHPSWRGLVMLVRRATNLEIAAECVYERCRFRVLLGSNRRLDHEPYYGMNVSDDDRGDLVAAYATATLDDGRTIFRVLSRKELDKRRSLGGPVWSQHYEAMCRKSAIRALVDWLPVPDELRDFIKEDAEREAPETVTQLPTEHAAPTGDTRTGWNGGAVSPESIRSRGPKKTEAKPPVDTTAREPEQAPEGDPGDLSEDEEAQFEADAGSAA